MVWVWWCGVVSVCSLKHYWPVHVECGGWGSMIVWNRGLVSPGLCSRMSLPTWWRDWIYRIVRKAGVYLGHLGV